EEQYLIVAAADTMLRDAATLWIAQYLRVFEEGRELAPLPISDARISMPGDTSFGSASSALAHIRGAMLPDSIALPWKQALLDVLVEYPIQSAESRFSIDPALAHLG